MLFKGSQLPFHSTLNLQQLLCKQNQGRWWVSSSTTIRKAILKLAMAVMMGKNASDGVMDVTPKVILDQLFHPCFDVDNAPSQDDDESASNSSTSNSSFLKWRDGTTGQRKMSGTWIQCLLEDTNAQASVYANFSAGSSTTTAKTSNHGNGVTGTSSAPVGQSNAWIGAFHPHLPYNQDNGNGSDNDGEQSNQSYLENTSND